MKEKFGVAPEQVVDVLALMGDSIDNIKGVPGIGEKGARDLIAKYGIARGAARARRARSRNKRYREGLLAHADDARQSRELARIRTDVPVDFDAETLRYRGAVARALLRALHPARVPHARDGVRADGGDDRQGLRVVASRRRSCAALVDELRSAGRFALRVLPDGPVGDARRRSSAYRSFSTPRRGAIRPDRQRSSAKACSRRDPAAAQPASISPTALDAAEAAARGRGDR